MRRAVVIGGAVVALCAWPGSAGAATIKVDLTDDELNADADCSLREAVQAANSNEPVSGCAKGQGGNRDVIKLQDTNYELQIASTDESGNADGDLDVGAGGALTILGKGRQQTTIVQNVSDDRILDAVGGSPDLTVEALDLAGGNVAGLSSAQARGGSVRVASASGKLKLQSVRQRLASAQVGGAIYVSNDSRATISRSELTDSDATGTGGSIGMSNSARVTLKRAVVTGNEMDSADGIGTGGAIQMGAAAGALKIVDSQLSSNAVTTSDASAARGGAIYASGPVDVRRSLFVNNAALATENGNGEDGGAIYAGSSGVRVANSTFYNNQAGNGDGLGGAILGATGDTPVHFSTFVGNTADLGNNLATVSTARIEVGRSIIDGAVLFGSPCDGDGVVSEGFNVSEDDDADCNHAASDVVEPPSLGLGVLDDNGGPTQTIGLEAGSPAVNLVPKAKCKPAKGTDQRGFKRPKGKRCDAGAFERGAQE